MAEEQGTSPLSNQAIEKALGFKREFVIEDGRTWPALTEVSKDYCALLNKRMKLLIAPDRPTIDLESYNNMCLHGRRLSDAPIPELGADLGELLTSSGIESRDVIFSLTMMWGFEEAVSICRSDLIDYFDDLWFSDDFL